MDVSDATSILFERLQKLDSEIEVANKIIGTTLLQDDGGRGIIRLACAPEKVLENLVQKTKLHMGYLDKPPVSASLTPPIAVNPPAVSEVPMNYMSFSPNGSQLYTSPPPFRVPPAPYWNQHMLTPEQQHILSSDFASYGDSVVDDYSLQNPGQFIGFDDQLEPFSAGAGCFPADIYFTDAALGSLNMRNSRRSQSLTEFPTKTCHYFNRGFCKHGNSCRFLHGPDHFSPIYNPHDTGADDHMFSPGSLEKLELEISELLKSNRGPVSIASLPMLYFETYGRHLQADGYLTESQRHGRAGYSLTKLLARLKRIRLIDRPHGQHSVIVAEDASKYNVENRSERNDPGTIVSGSRQIYLTFPAESTFTEEDVSTYFGDFGTVEDVRIPCQQKRMFGFVTFASADTVKTVLAKGNPHFVHGSRVLVKPYREKSKLVGRKYGDKNDHGMYYHGTYLELEYDFHPMPRCEAPRFIRRQLMEEQEQALELETRRLSALQLGRKNNYNLQLVSNRMGELTSLDDPTKYTSAEQYHYLLDVINNSSVSDERSNHLGQEYLDQESQGINLPESPFASAIVNGISAVI